MTFEVLRKMARAGRSFPLTWRYGFNFGPTLSYVINRKRIPSESRRVVASLNTNGISITTVGQLLQGESYYQELVETVAGLNQTVQDRLRLVRASAEYKDAVGQKTFNVELLGERPQLDATSIYARFALQKSILQIANAYFGMFTCLRYYNIWHTFATQSEPRESQLWHRDREDNQILKIFVYLSHVNDGAGALTYAPGTHAKGNVRHSPESFLEGTVLRSYDSQMAKVVPESRWIKATGPKGTIVFADTHGYHKGGLARHCDRLMYTCMFTSSSSQSKELFRRGCELPRFRDKALDFALSRPGHRH